MPPHPRGTAMIQMPPASQQGPAMRALSPSKRAFVEALLQNPHCDYSRAALLAGYTGVPSSLHVMGSRIAHEPGVTAAIREESLARMGSLLPLALERLRTVLNDESQAGTTTLKAAGMILDRAGLPTQSEQKITVEKHETPGDQVERIVRLAKLLGQDPRLLLGQYGIQMADAPVLRTAAPVIDAEFTDVPVLQERESERSTDGLEDIL